MSDMTESDRLSKEGRWRAAMLVLNAVLEGVGLWAVLRPNNTDVIEAAWSISQIYAIFALVLVPALSMIALLRPANRMFAWPAMIANASSAMLGTAWVVEHGIRTLEDLRNQLLYPFIAMIVGPCLVIAMLWRYVHRTATRSDEAGAISP